MNCTPCIHTWRTNEWLKLLHRVVEGWMMKMHIYTWRITKHNSYANTNIYLAKHFCLCASVLVQSVRQMCEHLPLEWGIIYYLHLAITLCSVFELFRVFFLANGWTYKSVSHIYRNVLHIYIELGVYGLAMARIVAQQAMSNWIVN